MGRAVWNKLDADVDDNFILENFNTDRRYDGTVCAFYFNRFWVVIYTSQTHSLSQAVFQ